MSRETTPGFDAWYAVYPRKQARGDAFKAWEQVEGEEIADEILSKTKRYPFSKEKMYIPLPATFLRAWRWEDEPQEEEEGGNDW